MLSNDLKYRLLKAVDEAIDAAHNDTLADQYGPTAEGVREEFRYELLTALYVHIGKNNPEVMGRHEIGACIAWVLDDEEHPDYDPEAL